MIYIDSEDLAAVPIDMFFGSVSNLIFIYFDVLIFLIKIICLIGLVYLLIKCILVLKKKLKKKFKYTLFGRYVYKKATLSKYNYLKCIVRLYIAPFTRYNKDNYSGKWRFSQARVDKITDLNGYGLYSNAISYHDNNFIYRIGETVYPKKPFDASRCVCGSGIHAFSTFNEAVNYNWN